MHSDRLSELRRQRASAADHLACLDSEIAAENAMLAPETASEATLEAYQPNPSSVRRDTKRGCFAYFAAALLAFTLTLAAIYFLFYRDRPLLFSADQRPADMGPDHRKSP